MNITIATLSSVKKMKRLLKMPVRFALKAPVIAAIPLLWSISGHTSTALHDPDLSYVQNVLSAAASASLLYGDGAYAGASASPCFSSCQGVNGNPFQSNALIAESQPGTASAQASANLASGYLQADAQEFGITGSSAAGAAAYWDTLTFSGAAGPSPMGNLTLTVPGTFTDVGSGGACIDIGASCDPFSTATLNSSNPSETLTIPFSIVNGNPLKIYAALYATASNSFNIASADLYDPPHLSLELPAGVTYTSASGVFLASPVPLPAAFWIFGSGLLGLVSVARRNIV